MSACFVVLVSHSRLQLHRNSEKCCSSSLLLSARVARSWGYGALKSKCERTHIGGILSVGGFEINALVEFFDIDLKWAKLPPNYGTSDEGKRDGESAKASHLIDYDETNENGTRKGSSSSPACFFSQNL